MPASNIVLSEDPGTNEMSENNAGGGGHNRPHLRRRSLQNMEAVVLYTQ